MPNKAFDVFEMPSSWIALLKTPEGHTDYNGKVWDIASLFDTTGEEITKSDSSDREYSATAIGTYDEVFSRVKEISELYPDIIYIMVDLNAGVTIRAGQQV